MSLFGFLDWFSCWKCFQKGRKNGQGLNEFMKFGRINPGLPGNVYSIMDEWTLYVALLLSKHYSTGKPSSWSTTASWRRNDEMLPSSALSALY